MSEIKDCPTCGSKVTVEGDEGTYFYKPVETPEILVLTPDKIQEQDEILTMREKFELVRLIAPSETDEGVLVFYGEQAKYLGAYLPDSLICVRRQGKQLQRIENSSITVDPAIRYILENVLTIEETPTEIKIFIDGERVGIVERSVQCEICGCHEKSLYERELLFPNEDKGGGETIKLCFDHNLMLDKKRRLKGSVHHYCESCENSDHASCGYGNEQECCCGISRGHFVQQEDRD